MNISKLDINSTVDITAGCFWCHFQLDQGALFTYAEKLHFFYLAMCRWAPFRQAMYGVPALPCLEALQ